VIAGRGFGMESPVRVFADTFNVAVDLEPGAELAIAAEAPERALYVLEGRAQVDGADIPEKHLLVLDRGVRHVLRASTPLKAMLFGGEPLDAPRHMWWNFVSSSKERLEQAKADWNNGAFGLIPGDDVERIPLPER
jgi:redox-sensitive bicupin YhaK (pirin superfamily)